MSRFPFSPYPRGWYRIAHSYEVTQNPLSVEYFGTRLTLRRDRNNAPKIFGVNPQISGTCEQDGLVYAHYDVTGKEPSFNIPPIEEFSLPRYGKAYHLRWRFRSHVQELAENGVDYPHFTILHKFTEVPMENSLIAQDDALQFSSTTQRRIFGFMSSSHMLAKFFGLGFAETSLTTNHVRIVTRLTPTPLNKEELEVDLTVVFEKKRNPLLNWLGPTIIMPQIKQEFDRDIMVWEPKVYRSLPVLCASDGPIMKVRKWAQRFYA